MVKINSPKKDSPYDHQLIAMKDMAPLKKGDQRECYVHQLSDKRFGVMTSGGSPQFYKVFNNQKEMDEAFNEQLSII